MPLRRESVSPQDQIEALTKRITQLERSISRLSQPGRSSIQVIDTARQWEPIEGELVVHHPGNHQVAAPSAPVKYWHDGQWRSFGASEHIVHYAYLECFGNILHNTFTLISSLGESNPEYYITPSPSDHVGITEALSGDWGVTIKTQGFYIIEVGLSRTGGAANTNNVIVGIADVDSPSSVVAPMTDIFVPEQRDEYQDTAGGGHVIWPVLATEHSGFHSPVAFSGLGFNGLPVTVAPILRHTEGATVDFAGHISVARVGLAMDGQRFSP